MDDVEGMLKSMQLSEEERKSVKIGSEMGVGGNDRQPQAVARLFSEKRLRPWLHVSLW